MQRGYRGGRENQINPLKKVSNFRKKWNKPRTVVRLIYVSIEPAEDIVKVRDKVI